MKKSLVFILIIALFATFWDHETLQSYKEKLNNHFSSEVQATSYHNNATTLATIRQNLLHLQTELELGKGQTQVLEEIAASMSSAQSFRQKHCIERQFHPLFFGESINKLCSALEDFKER